MTRQQRSGRTRTILAAGIVTLTLAGAGMTAAAYVDQATLNLGSGTPGSGIGNPDRFDIAVSDATGALQDAAAPADAVVLPITGGTMLSELVPVRLDVTVTNRDPGIAGDLTLSVYDPDPSAGDLFDLLRFTVYLDGSATPAVTDATAQQVADAMLRFEDVQPGEQHTVTVSMVIAENSGVAVAGKTTQVGLLTDGESR